MKKILALVLTFLIIAKNFFIYTYTSYNLLARF